MYWIFRSQEQLPDGDFQFNQMVSDWSVFNKNLRGVIGKMKEQQSSSSDDIYDPYVLTQFQNYKQYIDQLRVAELSVPNFLRARMSQPMQHLFDLILRMCAKKQSQRADFK